MSVVETNGTLDPADPNTVISLGVEDVDGDPCRQFTPDGPVEIFLVGSQRPRDAAGRDGLKILTLALRFPNYPIARFRANGIAHALGQLERAIERAQADADHAIPTRDDGHPHTIRFVRFARTMPRIAICEVCMEVLVDDIGRWAIDRGLMSDERPSRYIGDTDAATIKAAIEKAFNQDGGTDG